MKQNQLNEFKKQDEKALLEKVSSLKLEITDRVIDKKMNKMKDLKQINKNRRSIAQILTIWRQKQILKELALISGPVTEAEIEEEVEEDKDMKKKERK